MQDRIRLKLSCTCMGRSSYLYLIVVERNERGLDSDDWSIVLSTATCTSKTFYLLWFHVLLDV